ncbi:MAG TPA: hypothetical protein VH062_26585 [Polyangiaceae bacterium]|jgi:hypothetical protein|nr:hypothetical protein [Polyangiaceae bacterium]
MSVPPLEGTTACFLTVLLVNEALSTYVVESIADVDAHPAFCSGAFRRAIAEANDGDAGDCRAKPPGY